MESWRRRRDLKKLNIQLQKSIACNQIHYKSKESSDSTRGDSVPLSPTQSPQLQKKSSLDFLPTLSSSELLNPINSMSAQVLRRKFHCTKKAKEDRNSSALNSGSALHKSVSEGILIEEGADGTLQGVEKQKRHFMGDLTINADDVPKLPLVFVGGLMGFDKLGPIHYWRGIAKYLESQGCTVAIAKVLPTSSIHDRATNLKNCVENLLRSLQLSNSNSSSSQQECEVPNIPNPLYMSPNSFSTGLSAITKDTDINVDPPSKFPHKVHLIAHSMGGLDARYYISVLGGHQHVYSLTTVATPHRGSPIADWVCTNIGEKLKVERMVHLFGICTDAFHQLCPSWIAKEFNPKAPNHPDVFYHSYAGNLHVSRLSPMRLFFKRLLMIEGENDGLVSVSSAIWGEFLGAVQLDHLEQINWNPFKDVRYLYHDVALLCREKERERANSASPNSNCDITTSTSNPCPSKSNKSTKTTSSTPPPLLIPPSTMLKSKQD